MVRFSPGLLTSLSVPSGSDPHQPATCSGCFAEIQTETAAPASGKRKGGVGAQAGSSREQQGSRGRRGLC